MGSEVFKLKSIDLEPTVVRGARSGFKNAKTTPALPVNYSDPAVVHSGEHGVGREYLVQSSLAYNDFKGDAVFTNGSDVATGYTAPYLATHGDVIRHDGDMLFYTVTGMDGTNVYLTQKYAKLEQSDPDTQGGVCTVRRVVLDSVNYETYESSETGVPFYFDKDRTEWHPTGANAQGPYVAYSGPIDFSTGIELQFVKATKTSAPDLSTVDSVRKTLVDSNKQDVVDVSLSPMPFPHSSLKVWWGLGASGLEQKTEFEDYVVNYSQSPDFAYPYPPYEERSVAYLKFLGSMTDEVQITGIGPTTAGIVAVSKEVTVQSTGAKARKPVQRIIYGTDSVKIGPDVIDRQRDYVMDYDAGTMVFVDHRHAEMPYDHVAVPRDIMWNGISVIRGVPEDEVRNEKDMVIPGITGLKDVPGVLYFEDADQNNLVSGTDYTIEYTSGAIRLTNPLKKGQAVLVSYYVEGEDVEVENLSVSDTRLNKYPILRDSVTILKRWARTDQYGRTESGSTVLVEGTDFEMSYFTGHVRFLNPSTYTEDVKSLEVTYTPLSQVNCILQSKEGDRGSYRMTVVDDALEVVEAKEYLFKVNNPVVSVPVEDYFKKPGDPSKYSFSGTVLTDAPVYARVLNASTLDTVGWVYDDQTRQLSLPKSRNTQEILDGDIVVCTYSFEGDTLPYAPMQITYPFIAGGTNRFLIEGFDRTDVIKVDTILRVDNLDPVARYYFIVQNVTYSPEGTYVTVQGTFPEDINAPLFLVLDAPVVWTAMPEDSILDSEVLLGTDTLTFSGGTLEIQQTIKPNTLLLVDGTDVYSVISVTVSGSDTVIGIQPPLVRAFPATVVHSRTPVYDVGETTLTMRHYVLGDTVPEPAFTVSYVPPTGFDGSAMVYVDAENVTLFESINGVPNPVPYVYRKLDYPSVQSLANAIQGTKSRYNDDVEVGPRVPEYCPFTVSPQSEDKSQYFLDSGVYSADLIMAFEQESPSRVPYTLTITPELLRWSLVRAYKGQSSITVKDIDLTGRYVGGDLFAIVGATGAQYFGFTGVSVEEVDGRKYSKLFLKDTFNANLFDPTVYLKRSVRWVPLPNFGMFEDASRTSLTFHGGFASMVKPGTLLRFNGRYVHAVEYVSEGIDGNLSVTVNPPLREDCTVVGAPGGSIEQSDVPICLGQTPDQPYVVFEYTAPPKHVAYGFILADDEKLRIAELIVDTNQTKTVWLYYNNYTSMVELCAAVGEIESSLPGNKPFKATIPDAYLSALASDPFDKYRVAPCNTVMPYEAKMAVGTLSIDYQIPAGYTGVGAVKVSDTQVSLMESLMAVGGGDQLVKFTDWGYAQSGSFLSLALAVEQTDSVVGSTVHPFVITYHDTKAFVGSGSWDTTHMQVVHPQEWVYSPWSTRLYVTTDFERWQQQAPFNIRRLVVEEDYTVDAGLIGVESPIEDLDRFSLSYMGRDLRSEDEGKSVSVTCRYFSALAAGSRLDVYLDYKALDQFYIQKLTERKFTDLVVVPQLEEFLEQIGSGSGQGADTAPTDETIQNWSGGVTNNYYLLQDEEIKKQLYMKFYHWYKQRLRNFASELQLTMGFKFGKSNAVGEVDGRLTLQDDYVETEDYNLTTDDEIAVVPEGYSKFFPIGYGQQAPRYYPRFGKEYRLYNDVYCFNVRYKHHSGSVETIGYIKAIKPYWTQNLDHVILKDTNDNLVAYYEVPISEEERAFKATDAKYSWLKRLSVGDKIGLYNGKKKYTIMEITSGTDSQTEKPYELIKLDRAWSKKGIKRYRLRQDRDGDFWYYVLSFVIPIIPPVVVPTSRKSKDEFLAALPAEGRNVALTRTDAEAFPIFDDEGSYGFKIEGGEIEGYDKNDRRKNRIRKVTMGDFLSALFLIPMPQLPQNVRVQVGKYNEDTLEFTPVGEDTIINISELSRIEQRKVSSTQEGLYKNKLDDDELLPGIEKFAFLDFETVYVPDEDDGYLESFVLRSKDRDQWVRFIVEFDGDENSKVTDVAEEYGFVGNQVYKGFYDPDNVYRWMLMEKQTWQTEEAILKDLYDYNDKLARAFKQGRLRLDNVSAYKGYLANYIAGQPAGVSDWLGARLTKYERALYFLIGGYLGYGDQGSPLGIMRPDGVHDENEASPQIAQSYSQASTALVRYQSFYNALQEYKYINAINNATWKGDYVRWVTGLVEGLMHQKTARTMYDTSRAIDVGLFESDAFTLNVVTGTRYTVTGGAYTISGDTMYLYATLEDTLELGRLVPPYSRAFSLKNGSGTAFISLAELSALVSGTLYDGIHLFAMTTTYQHYPYADETCQLLVRGSWTLDVIAINFVKITNVEDHRASDPRILYLNRMVEDKLQTDNQTDPKNPYWVWPLYSANGNVAKKAIEGMPVSGSWEEQPSDYFEVLRVWCTDSAWSVRYSDQGEDGSDVKDAKTYSGPQDVIDKIDNEHVISQSEFSQLVVIDTPQVTILKQMSLVRHGREETSLTFNLRQYATVSQLVDAINAARFNSEGAQDPAGTLQLFKAEVLGGDDHGKFNSFEIQVGYKTIKKDFSVQDDEDEDVQYPKRDFVVGWELEERFAKANQYLTFSVRPQRYSVDPTTKFLMDGPEQAYQNTLSKFPLGLRKDINAFDLYCWDEVDGEGRREYEVLDNVMYFRSANVPSVAVPLAGSGDEFAPARETLRQLVDRINVNPVVGKWFYANLKFTRDEERDPGYFEYGYLPNFRSSVPKATLQNFELRKDAALRLRSSEDAEYRVEPDGPYNPLDTTTVFNSLRLRVRSNVRSLAVGIGSGYSISSSSMVVDDTADTLDLSVAYTYVYQYSRTFQFSDTSYDTVGELVTAINGTTIPGVGGGLFTATLDTAGTEASTRLLQASGTVVTFPTTTQLYEQNVIPIPPTLAALKLSVASSAGIYTISNARYSVPASRSQITVSCTVTYVSTYTPATINISAGNYTVGTLASYISTLKPYPVSEFPPIFSSYVFNEQYGDTDASSLLDVTTSVTTVGYASVQASQAYDFAGRTLAGIASDVTTDRLLTGVWAEVIGDYGSAEAILLVPRPTYSAVGPVMDLEADFRGLIGLRLLNMFDPAYATFYTDYTEIVADGNYRADLDMSDKDLHAWIDSVRGDLGSGMLGVQVLPIKIASVPYGLPLEQSKALPYNIPTHVYFGVMGDIKFVQISDQSLHVQVNNVKRRLGKPWTVDGVVEEDHYTPETYSGPDNLNAIDMEHFLGWLRNTRYTQIHDSVVNEALVANKHLWLFMKFHREIGCDQRAYQLRKRIENVKESQTDMRGV